MRTEPGSPKEQALDDALTYLARRLAEEGLTLDMAFITIKVNEKDDEGEDAATVFHAEGDEENLPDMLAFMLAQTRSVGKKLGVKIEIVPLRGGPLS